MQRGAVVLVASFAAGLGCGSQTGDEQPAPVDASDASVPDSNIDDGPAVYDAPQDVVSDPLDEAPSPDAATGPVVLATGQSGPHGIALDATHVYWTNLGSVARVPKSGGAVEILASVGQNNEVIAVDDQFAYFADGDGGAIRRVAKTGGTPTTIAQNQSFPRGLGLDATHVYWASEGDDAIRRVAKSGGSVETLATGQTMAFALAVDGGEVFWTLVGGPVRKLQIDSCCNVTELSPSQGTAPLSLAADATHVYWASQSSGSLRKVPRGGGASQELGFVFAADGIALDATHVYVGEDSNPGSVRRCAKDGSGCVPIATMQAAPRGVAVDATHVYWTNSADDTVYKLAK